MGAGSEAADDNLGKVLGDMQECSAPTPPSRLAKWSKRWGRFNFWEIATPILIAGVVILGVLLAGRADRTHLNDRSIVPMDSVSEDAL